MAGWRRAILPVVLVLAAVLSARADSFDLVIGTMPEDYIPGLRQILTDAVSKSPLALQGQIDLANAEAARYQSYAVYWPTVSANGGYGVSSARVASSSDANSTSKGFTYGASIGRDLFEWGADKAGVDIAKLQQKIANRNFDQAYALLAVTIRSQYLTLIQKKLTLRNSRFQLALQRKQLESETQKAKDGMISRDSIGPLTLSFKESELNLDRYQTDFDFTKRVFMRLAGIESLPEEAIPTVINRPVYHEEVARALLNQYIGGGVESTFQDDVLRMSIEQQKLQYKIVKYTLFPKLGVSAGYSVSNSTSASGGQATVASVASENYGVNAGWYIFDGMRTHYQKMITLAARRTAERAKKTYEETSIDTATNFAALCGYSDRALDIAVTRRDLDQNGVNQLTEQVKLGVVSQGTLDSQTTNFNSSDASATAAICDYLARWTDFVSAVGKDPALQNLPSAYVR